MQTTCNSKTLTVGTSNLPPTPTDQGNLGDKKADYIGIVSAVLRLDFRLHTSVLRAGQRNVPELAGGDLGVSG